MKTTILFAVLMGVSICLAAQGGAIHGKIFDEYGEPVYSANISIVDGPTSTGTSSDFEGEFKIKPLNAGTILLRFLISVIIHNNCGGKCLQQQNLLLLKMLLLLLMQLCL